MTSDNTTEQPSRSFMRYAALKTAIVNDEEVLVEQLLKNQSMQLLEKAYLLDLARITDNRKIIELLDAVTVVP